MARVNYNVIAQKYRNVGKGNVRLTQSSLFLTKPINPAVTTYNFDVLETQTATLQNDEIRLNLNDEFIITQIGMYLVGNVNGTPGRILFTSPPFELNTTQADRLTDFYNGAFKIAINNIVYMEKWDTYKHQSIGTTQFQSFQAGVSVAPTFAENNFAKSGMYGVEPMITLSGAKKNDLTLQIPAAITAGVFAWTDYSGMAQTLNIDRVGLLLRGFNAQNGATFQG
tara:strand:- start:7992 stop:8666 length:675 start_codon:yes stop_codon:yes gene_type:complete